jgi:hypothetical protein
MYIDIPVPDEEPSLFLIGHQDFIHDLSRPVIYPKYCRVKQAGIENFLNRRFNTNTLNHNQKH